MEIRREDIKLRVREQVILAHYQQNGEILVPVAVSAHHVHLDQASIVALFGAELHSRNALSQPGQFAAEESVTIIGPKGSIKNVRVLGPARRQTQAELSVTDCFTLGISPLVRLSGNTSGTPGFTLEGPRGRLSFTEGAIVAQRHMHASINQAQALGLANGDAISLFIDGARPMVIQGITLRVQADFELEAHLDTDEANAALLSNGSIMIARHERNSL